MSISLNRRLAGTLLVAAATVCGGCTQGGTQSPAPVTAATSPHRQSAATPATAPLVTPTSTTTPFTGTPSWPSVIPLIPRLPIPELAKVESADGAVEFVRYAVQQVNRSYRYADTDQITHVFSRDCRGGDDLQGSVLLLGASNAHAVGDIWAVHSATVKAHGSGSTDVDVVITEARVDLVDDTGKKTSTVTGGTYRYAVSLRFTNGWLITRWDWQR